MASDARGRAGRRRRGDAASSDRIGQMKSYIARGGGGGVFLRGLRPRRKDAEKEEMSK